MHPLVVVVDDLQWIDRPSAETSSSPPDGCETSGWRWSWPPGHPTALDPLDEDDLGTLLRSVPTLSLSGLSAAQAPRLLPGVAAQVAAALAERSGGNPLAMLEAASLLEPEVLSGTRRMPQNLPVTGADATYRLRLAGLTAPAREGCRVMALAGRAPGDLVVEALTKVSVSVSDLSEVEEAGLGRLTVDGVQWRHPLARSAAAEGSVDQVRRIHAVLAECWSGVPGSRPQWAWHRAESVWGPDQSAADALADVARLSAEREASLEAADAWERAAVLGEDPVLRRQWLGLAARAAFRGGASARAARLYDLALDDGPDPAAPEARAVLLHERGRVEHGLGRPVRAYDLLISAARSSVGRRATMAAAEAVHAAMYARRADLAQVAAAAAGAAHDPAHPIAALSRPARRGRGGRAGGRPAGGSPAHERGDLSSSRAAAARERAGPIALGSQRRPLPRLDATALASIRAGNRQPLSASRASSSGRPAWCDSSVSATSCVVRGDWHMRPPRTPPSWPGWLASAPRWPRGYCSRRRSRRRAARRTCASRTRTSPARSSPTSRCVGSPTTCGAHAPCCASPSVSPPQPRSASHATAARP